METPQKYDVMQEILKVFVEALRKQAFSVLLLLLCCGGLTKALIETRREWREQITASTDSYNKTVASLQEEIRLCVRDREALAVKVAALSERLDLLLPRRGK